MKRKIAAIMAADVAGYSKLVAEDEEETLRRLAAYRAVFDDFIAKAGGRIFNTAGDAVLAEFPSAVEAVRCAIDVQESLRTRNLAYPPSRQMNFRIGITIGDVVERDGDLLGDGVNIAARLEGIAPVGGICISRAVHEQVANKLSVPFADIGEQQVKNIPTPVHAFLLRLHAEDGAKAAAASKKSGSSASRWKWPAAVALLGAGAIAAAIAYLPLASYLRPVSTAEREAPAAPAIPDAQASRPPQRQALVPETVPFVSDRDRAQVRAVYMSAPDRKALAVSGVAMGLSTGQPNEEVAKQGALEMCQRTSELDRSARQRRHGEPVRDIRGRQYRRLRACKSADAAAAVVQPRRQDRDAVFRRAGSAGQRGRPRFHRSPFCPRPQGEGAGAFSGRQFRPSQQPRLRAGGGASGAGALRQRFRRRLHDHRRRRCFRGPDPDHDEGRGFCRAGRHQRRHHRHARRRRAAARQRAERLERDRGRRRRPTGRRPRRSLRAGRDRRRDGGVRPAGPRLPRGRSRAVRGGGHTDFPAASAVAPRPLSPPTLAASKPTTLAATLTAMLTLAPGARDDLAKVYEGSRTHKALVGVPGTNRHWRFAARPSAEIAQEGALEGCQVWTNQPCALIALDDRVTAEPTDGKWPTQDMPRVHYAGTFDPERIPSALPGLRERADVVGYRNAPGPKAAAFHPWGRIFAVTNAESQRAAEERALADCNADPTRNGQNGPCFLYAAGDQVILPERRSAPVAAAPAP